MEYHKINSVFKRDNKGRFMTDVYSCQEFAYLAHNLWVGTEKIDGTNIRMHWDGCDVTIKGRTDKANIPPFLLKKLESIVSSIDFNELFGTTEAILYGEGYGNKIQKVGKNYIEDGTDFILFDIRIGKYWLRREDVNVIAKKAKIESVPEIFAGTLFDAIDFVMEGFHSTIGKAQAEGLVLIPVVPMLDRCGNRIITKLKTRDFN